MLRRYISVVLAFTVASAGFAQVTNSFTYQGELESSGSPASGVYDFRFRLYDAASGGVQVGPTLCADNLAVAGGRFSIEMDFGSVFSGASRFLEIEVRADSGFGCGNLAGFTILAPRQGLTAAPHASYSLRAADASLLGGQNSAFYTSATNISTGVLPDARLSGNIGTLAGTQTFSGVKTFSSAPSFTSAGAPMVVTSSARVANLNSDLLDGLDSSAFALAVHTHTASAITSGTLDDARLSSNIPRLSAANLFLTTQAVTTTAQSALSLSTNNAQGSWLNIGNTAAGGRTFNLITTGPGNGEGAGKLLLRDQNSPAIRLTVDSNGDVGIGNTDPREKLDIVGSDPGLRMRNANDDGGAVFRNTWGSVQLGMFNALSTLDFGVIPPDTERYFLGFDNIGRVGSLTNAGAGPVFRNLIDDGSGNAAIGTVAPEARLHVARGSAGAVTADSNSVFVAEANGNVYLSVLSPNASERGVLFGSPLGNADGGIFYNSLGSRGLEFRTAGNVPRMSISSAGVVTAGGVSLNGPTGRIAAANMPAIKEARTVRDPRNLISWSTLNGGFGIFDTISVNVPSQGHLLIEGEAQLALRTDFPGTGSQTVYVKIEETTSGSTLLQEENDSFSCSFGAPGTAISYPIGRPSVLIPTNAGVRTFRVVVTDDAAGISPIYVGTTAIRVTYYPGSL